MKYQDYYQTLGVSRQADASEIKKAYRKLARKYHPDVSKEADAEAKFKEVGEAYEVLRDDEKRAAYNQLGSDWQPGQEFSPPPGWQPSGFDNGHSESSFSFENFSDLFGEIYGGQRHRGGGSRASTDLHATLHLTLEQLVRQEPVDMVLRNTQTGQPRTLRVKVPGHLRDGDTFRLKGQGANDVDGGRTGDLYVTLRFIPHPRFEIIGNDLHAQLRVSPWEAVLGAKVPVETLKGTVNLTVPPRSVAGTTLRLKGRGLGGSQTGHQFVHLEIDVPSNLTDQELDRFQSLAKLSAFNPRD